MCQAKHIGRGQRGSPTIAAATGQLKQAPLALVLLWALVTSSAAWAQPDIDRPLLRPTQRAVTPAARPPAPPLIQLPVSPPVQPSPAPSATKAPELSIEQAFRLAVESHPSVMARRSERDAADQTLEGAKWGRFPTVSVQNGLDQQGDRVTTARIEQPLWAGGLISGRIDAGAASLKKSQASLIEAEQDMLARVADAYTDLGRLEARKAIAQANVQEHERLVAMIARRVESEVSPESDSVLAQARLSQARAEMGQFDGQAVRARAALSQAIGVAAGPIGQPVKPALPFGTLDAALDAGFEFSPVLLRLASEIDAQEAEISIARGSALPRVVARYDQNWGDTVNRREDRVTLALEYQSGAGLSSVSNVRAAASRRDAARLSQDAARRQVTEAITGEWADLQSLAAQQQDLQAQVSSTAGIFDSYVRQYAVGRKSWIDVLNAQREASQARASLSDVQWGSLRAAYRLLIATGTIRAAAYGQPTLTATQSYDRKRP